MNQSSPPTGSGTNRLTDADRRILAEAAELTELRTTEQIRARFSGWDDTGAAYAEAFGYARYQLGELIALVERLGGQA